MKQYGYSKNEKLKQKKEISLLFEKGKWRTCGKVRIVFINSTSTKLDEEEIAMIESTKIGVSASKRFFKKATDRNKLKRLLRESYRLNKAVFEEKFGDRVLAMLFWNSSEKPKHFREVEEEFLNLCKSKK